MERRGEDHRPDKYNVQTRTNARLHFHLHACAVTALQCTPPHCVHLGYSCALNHADADATEHGLGYPSSREQAVDITTPMYAYTCAHTHADTHTHTHSHTRTHECACPRTRAHTRTHDPVSYRQRACGTDREHGCCAPWEGLLSGSEQARAEEGGVDKSTRCRRQVWVVSYAW